MMGDTQQRNDEQVVWTLADFSSVKFSIQSNGALRIEKGGRVIIKTPDDVFDALAAREAQSNAAPQESLARSPDTKASAPSERGMPPAGAAPDAGDLVERLWKAQVAGCTCEAKSPDLQWHDPLCHYRLFREAADTIAALRADLEHARARWEAELSVSAKLQQQVAELTEQNKQLAHGQRIQDSITMAVLERAEAAERERDRVTNLHKGLMQAVEVERDALRKDAERERYQYHKIMALLADTKMEHGKCQPRKDRACTHCNAIDDLATEMARYSGPPIVLSSDAMQGKDL